ncbi:EEF1A lysine methyltransferase 3-like isoform X2 [Stegostoma tigrinum]|uniref:EEF1A lysine methyltransferase 3-like isoform X2 n=1 Tax=Stegostoma tigrinum TaxID=3053191 RepID=UPI00202AE4F5|nr:EEF1A lysine methyltransferase 3-like isoform X2 [Stegostoma tigrinum]
MMLPDLLSIFPPAISGNNIAFLPDESIGINHSFTKVTRCNCSFTAHSSQAPTEPSQSQASGQNLPSVENAATSNQESFKERFKRMVSFQCRENTGRTSKTIEWLFPQPFISEKQFQFCGHILNIARHFGGNLGFSATVWEAALVLCQYFEQEKISFTGRKVIELGSGTGIVGILAVLLGGDVTMTDKENVLSQIEHNVSVNIPADCRHRSKVCALSWGKDHINFPTDYDFILGADIVYTSLVYPLLLKTLLHLSYGPTIIYLSTKLRRGNHSTSFHEEVLPKHFNCELVHRVEDKNISVYKISKLNPVKKDDPLM